MIIQVKIFVVRKTYRELQFNIRLPLIEKKMLTTGIINSTELITDLNNNKYIFQRINTKIFKDPSLMMDNIFLVTNHLKKKNIPTLDFLASDNNKLLYQDNSGSYRVSKYIENTISFDSKADSNSLKMAGFAFGSFIYNLSDLDASLLKEPIPNFHNTILRISHFLDSVKKDEFLRVQTCTKDIDFLLSLTNLAKKFNSERLPIRVTHNDTKTSNLLIDKTTLKVLAVIDLDTVMPGLLAYDFADAIRYSANYVTEDDDNYNQAGLNIDLYCAYAEGFIKAISPIITQKEIDSLVLGVLNIVYEQAIRFLDDYISGDIYYTCTKKQHNLIRAKTQIGLLKDMLNKKDQMENIIKRLLQKK